MTKQEAYQEWREYYLPELQVRSEAGGLLDKPARRESWNSYTDWLCRDKRITERQYNTWGHPRGLETVSATPRALILAAMAAERERW